jgi:hypothetical protein
VAIDEDASLKMTDERMARTARQKRAIVGVAGGLMGNIAVVLSWHILYPL